MGRSCGSGDRGVAPPAWQDRRRLRAVGALALGDGEPDLVALRATCDAYGAALIVDEAHLEHPKMPLVPLIDGWDTVEEMESSLGIPAGNLVATLRARQPHFQPA